MAKHPAPGVVKTRLAAQIGPQAACRLYRAFIRDLAVRLGPTAATVCWAVWPSAAPFRALVRGQRCIDQHGDDLGERLAHATAACLEAGPRPVLTIGVDAPHLDLGALAQAAAALGGAADVVVGPATDGGYYLIGLRAPCPALFRDVAWGTASVLEETLAHARAAGLRVHLLAPTFDVDDAAGLAALRALLAGGTVALPATAAVLAGLPPLTPEA